MPLPTTPEFDTAAADVKNLKNKPNDTALLKLYGLYKQATEGDCTTSKPGVFDPKGKYKWEAWDGNKGMAPETAQTQYIEYVKELQKAE